MEMMACGTPDEPLDNIVVGRNLVHRLKCGPATVDADG